MNSKNILSKLRLFKLEKVQLFWNSFVVTITSLFNSKFGLQAALKERRGNITEDKFELVHRHKVQVYQHLLYLLGNRAGVEDITQSTGQQKIGESFMKALVKCKFYLMMSLAIALFAVGTTAIGDQTDVSTEITSQIAKKPTIMILGSTHLANDGLDVYNTKMDDVRAPKRQREIEQLIALLKAYQPTKIAVEVDEKPHGAKFHTNYQTYLNGTYELNRSEIDQIGFRLAKQMGHSKLYCVDYRIDYRKDDPIIPIDEFDLTLLDYRGFAKANNLEHLLPPPPTEGKVTQGEKDVTWIEPEKYVSIIDMYIRDNEPEGIRKDHQLIYDGSRVSVSATNTRVPIGFPTIGMIGI